MRSSLKSRIAVSVLMIGTACAYAQQAHGPVKQSAWPFWNSYAARFISDDGRVMDPDRGSMTTSEGQSYAMFFSLVANDHVMFDRVRGWTETNLAQGSFDNNLPSWSWGRGAGGDWRVLDVHSAADSDLWLAYDLLQAGALWKNADYTRQGKAMLKQIAEAEVAEVPVYGPVLLPGAGFQPDADHWTLNPSYMPPALMNAAAQADPSGPWKKMTTTLPSLLQASAANGFAMDWVTYSSSGHFVPAGGPGDDPKPPQGSYDAIRVYLWIGMGSSENPARPSLLRAFSPMRDLLRAHPVPPEAVAPDGSVSGTGPLGFSAALVPFLWALHDKFLADEQQRRVQMAFDPHTGLLGTPARYYDQNLALFAIGWQEKRFRFGADGMLRVSWKN